MTKGYIPIFSTKIRKYLIVKKATIDDVTKPTTNIDILIFTWYKAKSAIKKTSAPSIVGIAKRKANFEESFKFIPIKRAAVIAVPDLEAPGNKGKAGDSIVTADLYDKKKNYWYKYSVHLTFLSNNYFNY